MEHEVAKLIGAPPGYLGHRETQPLLTQQKVTGAASESCDLSLVLFDEIEKAAPSMIRLLLGVLDRGVLRLGDNTTVNFEKSLVLLTSNLGAAEMNRAMRGDFGFQSQLPSETGARTQSLERIGMSAVRKSFPPEFVNRLDAVVTYHALGSEALGAILDSQVCDLQDHIERKLGEEAFRLEVPACARRFLLDRGASAEYGARELRRTVERLLIQPLASLVAAGEIPPGAHVRADLAPHKDRLILQEVTAAALAPAC